MQPPRPALVTFLAAAIAAVALSGCMAPGDGHGHGDDGHAHGDDHDDMHDDGHRSMHGDGMHGEGSGAGNLPLNGSEDRVFEIDAGVASEYRFTPDAIEVVEGERVGITFDNRGQAPHEFDIAAIGFHLHADPGTNVSAAFEAPAPGTYTVACRLPGHFESGMEGTLTVVAAA